MYEGGGDILQGNVPAGKKRTLQIIYMTLTKTRYQFKSRNVIIGNWHYRDTDKTKMSNVRARATERTKKYGTIMNGDSKPICVI